ncbi:uncharacterized protein LOC134215763 [Armigeres subalbatus]|uniref:uncharacterized protein LOC134215763 n=1 Tax=Armigeres subalbatus TaxID=124917 RepID=UPI002ED5BF2C
MSTARIVPPTEEELEKEKQAILGLKFLEIIWCVICIGIRAVGVHDDLEPFPHEMFFCGVYVGYALISVFFFVIVCCGYCKVNYVIEAVVSLAGFVAFAACGFRAMYHVEEDVHMRFLTDKGEWYHEFFIISRLESIFSMQTAGIFLVHGILMLDVLHGRNKEDYEQLRLVPFWVPPYRKLMRFCCICCCGRY